MELVGSALGIGLVVLIFWALTEMLHKAGYSRGWALLIPFTGFLGLFAFAFAEWPIHRELAWRRLAAGSGSERDLPLAQSYAVDLEKLGEWQRAIEVYETLIQRSPDKAEAEYVTNCIRRLREMLDGSIVA
jgi:hypothetical protein